MAVCIKHTAFSFTSPADSTRDRYIEEYPDKFYIKPVFTIRNLALKMQSRTGDISINYVPNGFSYLGLNLYIFEIGIGASFRLPKNTTSYSRFGETDFLDLQTNIYAKKWGADLSLQQYQGFYVNNPQMHFPAWKKGDPYPQRRDMQINKISANIFYIENNREFSYRSAYNQADRQRVSSGSFLIGANFLYQDISADSSLIPNHSQEDFGLDNFRWLSFYTFGIMPGYTHNFIYKYFYLNISLALGPAYVLNFYSENKQVFYNRQVRPLINLRAALGYNSPQWFAGVTFVNHSSTMATDHLEINGASGNIKIFFGYRFREVGVLKKKLL